MKQYKCRYFRIEELVDRDTFDKYGQKAWWFLDRNLLYTLDQIRKHLGIPITVNNWLWNQSRQWSGLRTIISPYYSSTSQHTAGRAADFLVKDMSAVDVRRWLYKNRNKHWLRYLAGIERNISWCHVDVRNEKFFYFNP